MVQAAWKRIITLGHNLSKTHPAASPVSLNSTSGYLDMLPIALTNALLAILTFNV